MHFSVIAGITASLSTEWHRYKEAILEVARSRGDAYVKLLDDITNDLDEGTTLAWCILLICSALLWTVLRVESTNKG